MLEVAMDTQECERERKDVKIRHINTPIVFKGLSIAYIAHPHHPYIVSLPTP